jgi:hypothetical protein
MAEQKTRAEVVEWIRSRVRQQPRCSDFDGEFRLFGNGQGWNAIATDPNDWSRDCVDAFKEAVVTAQKKFEIAG